MEEKIITFDGEKFLLTIFFTLILASIVLIFFESQWYNQVLKNSNSIDFRLTVTPESITVGNSYSNIIVPYFKSSNKIGVSIFPLKLPRVIKIHDRVINIEAWDFEISNVILLKDVEVNSRKIVQKANIVNLKIRLEEENREAFLNPRFKLTLETMNTTDSQKTFSGLLKPLTGHLYGGSYTLPEKEIKIIVTWKPFSKAILLTVYPRNGEIQNYLLESGKWSGVIRASKDGLNCLIIGNPDEDAEIRYSIDIL